MHGCARSLCIFASFANGLIIRMRTKELKVYRPSGLKPSSSVRACLPREDAEVLGRVSEAVASGGRILYHCRSPTRRLTI